MKMSELVAYAKQKYNMEEDGKWADFSGYSVLANPENKRWAALLMRSFDKKTGDTIEYCDIKCDISNCIDENAAYLSKPYRMKNKDWTGVKFDETTDKDVVFRLFDIAVAEIKRQSGYSSGSGYKIVIDNSQNNQTDAFHDTALPRYNSANTLAQKQCTEIIPEQILSLRRMIRESLSSRSPGDFMSIRAKDFYEQAIFMEDYTDDVPCSDYFFNYYPTYEILNTKLLRGYFTWRTKVRAGEYTHIAPSLAYIYIYELLNGIGADSEQEALLKLEQFESGYLGNSEDKAGMCANLRRWKFEFCIINDLPVETALKYANPKTIEKENAIMVLKNPTLHSDEEVYRSLMLFAEKVRTDSPVISKDEDAARRIFADAWRFALDYKKNGKGLFELCFGVQRTKKRYPLYNAVYYNQIWDEKRTYKLNEVREYKYDGTNWFMYSFDNLYFDLVLLRGFLHETDRKLRLYLKTGRSLKKKTDEVWAEPFIDEAIARFEKERVVAGRQIIAIEESNLKKIRHDAAKTRESLLTDEERGLDIIISEQIEDTTNTENADIDGVLSDVHTEILTALLNGADADEILKRQRIMPTIASDQINEALYDLIGDNVTEIIDGELAIIEDYAGDIARIIAGDTND